MENKTKPSENKQKNTSLLLEQDIFSTGKLLDILKDNKSLKAEYSELLQNLSENFDISPSWEKKVRELFDQKITDKDLHLEKSEVAISKTFNLSHTALFNLWADKKLRLTWFPFVSYTIVSVKTKKQVNLRWPVENSHVQINFFRKSKTKSELQIIHSKLTNVNKVNEMKNYWDKVLNLLCDSIDNTQMHNFILDL